MKAMVMVRGKEGGILEIFALRQASEAHAYMALNAQIGKIVLKVEGGFG